MPLALAFLTRSRNCAWLNCPLARHGDAQVRHQLRVVIDLDRGGFERKSVGALAEGPHLLCPRLDVVPVDSRRQIGEQIVFDVVRLVGLGVEHVGCLAGAQRGFQRRVERRLLVPGDLDLHPWPACLEALDRVLDVRPLADLAGPVAPHRELLCLRGDGHGAHGKESRCGQCPATANEPMHVVSSSLDEPSGALGSPFVVAASGGVSRHHAAAVDLENLTRDIA